MASTATFTVDRPKFIGCACDHLFAEPTAVMLTSVDVNGDVPDATVLVAAFGLDDSDRELLRAGAGNRPVRFIDVGDEMLSGIDVAEFTDEYPLPVLGRLFVANHVEVPGARMLTLDSDMIVNASLRPLFERDLGDQYFAAIHDPPRVDELTYFNSGITLFDVDTYKRHDIASRCLRWLASRDYHPHFPDQDALNEIVGHSWYRLARTWNHFCYNRAGFTAEEYETCKIAHFAGPKPWNDPNHPGAELYRRYLAELRQRMAKPEPLPVAGIVGRLRAAIGW